MVHTIDLQDDFTAKKEEVKAKLRQQIRLGEIKTFEQLGECLEVEVRKSEKECQRLGIK